MKVDENTIIYAAVALRHKTKCKTKCKIISDTLNEDPTFRNYVYQILYNMENVENEKFFVYKNKYTIHILFREFCYVCVMSKIECPKSEMIQRSVAQTFLQGLENAYIELPRRVNLNEPPERNVFPIKTLVFTHNIRNALDLFLEKEKSAVVGMLQDTITNILIKSDSFSEIIQKANKLDIWASKFKKLSPDLHNKLKWKKIKCILITVGLAIGISLLAIMLCTFLILL